MPRPNDVGVGVAVLFERASFVEDEPEILLGKRKGAHGAGKWSLPGGWIERGEEPQDTAVREAFEETGLIIRYSSSIKVLDAIAGPSESPDFHSVTIYVKPWWWEGDVQNKEPDKCEEWKWFSINELPSPLFKSVPKFLSYYYGVKCG